MPISGCDRPTLARMEAPHAQEASGSRLVTLLVVGNADDPYTLMIEPWGMTYELGESDQVSVELAVPDGGRDPELVAWPGGFSIWVTGRAVTRNADGKVLHEF